MTQVNARCAECKHCREVTITRYCNVWGYICKLVRNDPEKCGPDAKNWEAKK